MVPSSKTCSNCGNVKETLLLSERTYKWGVCKTEIDRDLNAAKIILKEGLNIKTTGIKIPIETAEEKKITLPMKQ